MTVTAGDVLAIARTQIGYVGGPGSPPTSKYGAWYGINPGDWCAMFISWCGNEAAAKVGDKNPYAGVESAKGFAYTPSGFAHYQGLAATVMDTKQGKAGDLVFYDYGMGRISHVAIIESVSSSNYTTIEGNTTDSAQGRTGNCVARHTHAHNESVFRGIGRPVYNGGIGNTTAGTGDDSNPAGPDGSNTITTGSNTRTLVIIGAIALVGVVILFTQT